MQRAVRSFKIFLSLVLCCLSASVSATAAEVDDGASVTREQWQARKLEARQRLDQMRRERKTFIPPPPTPEEIADERTRRAFDDNSLMPGDIVATRKGFFVFRGSPDRERQPEDFVPVQR